MKKLHLLSTSLLAGVVIAGSLGASALAWHPEGRIEKSVQNQTANSQLKDFVEAEPGDVLKYVIEISNTGKSDSRGWNDMHYTELKDTLPAGVELVSNPSQRQITESLGKITPGQKVTREYLVRVTSDKDGDLVTNKACFTGDSEVKDKPQKGCDDAKVKVSVSEPEEPAEEPAKEAKETEPQILTAATTLPKTGAGSLVGVFAGVTGLGYAAHRFISRKR